MQAAVFKDILCVGFWARGMHGGKYKKYWRFLMGVFYYLGTRFDAVAGEGGILGVITGRAIYEGTLDIAEAQAWCDDQLPVRGEAQ